MNLKKNIDGIKSLCYSERREMRRSLFFMLKNKYRNYKMNLSGGGSCAHKNHISMYRM